MQIPILQLLWEKAMMTITILTYTIFNFLILCNTWISASECPPIHKNNSSNLEAMKVRFDRWLKQNGWNYEDKEEWEIRFVIYQANVEYIGCKKSQKNSYNLTDNKFADLTNEEFVSTYLGFATRLIPHTRFKYHEHGNLP